MSLSAKRGEGWWLVLCHVVEDTHLLKMKLVQLVYLSLGMEVRCSADRQVRCSRLDTRVEHC